MDSDDKMTPAGSELRRQNHVHNWPTLVCFLNGERHEALVGVRPRHVLEAKIREWLAEPRAA